MGRADLHLHTCYSDGLDAPAEVVHRAATMKFTTIAITDHDTTAGVPEAQATGTACNVEVLAGIELTCRVDAVEVHLLGYFFGDRWRAPALQNVLERARQIRIDRMTRMVAQLNALGVPLRVEAVAALAVAGTTGRMHVARALVQTGAVRSAEEAFDRFLRPGKPGYVERERITAEDGITLIHQAGGVAVLAHPGLNHVDHRLAELAAQGLDGLEVWHTRHTAAQTQRYRLLTERLGLVATAGSDCHGGIDGQVLMGTVSLPDDYLAMLKGRR
jgi:predicted metal-dependent phosphoesterase TrpH